jgi:uncharacterized oligopeptide transporter (OPT) family protein
MSREPYDIESHDTFAVAPVSKDEQHEEISVEKGFEGTYVPMWQKQVTVRAIFVSLMLSVMFTFIVMKLNLTTGIMPSLNVSAGLLGFFFVKTWTKLLEKAGWLNQPFTRKENTVIQTCVVTTNCGFYSTGFWLLIALSECY